MRPQRGPPRRLRVALVPRPHELVREIHGIKHKVVVPRGNECGNMLFGKEFVARRNIGEPRAK